MTVTHPRPQGRAATTPAQALARARDHLLSLQHDQGWWQGELETNVTMDAEDLLLREFLGIRTREQTEAAARWIASKQREDGTSTRVLQVVGEVRVMFGLRAAQAQDGKTDDRGNCGEDTFHSHKGTQTSYMGVDVPK